MLVGSNGLIHEPGHIIYNAYFTHVMPNAADVPILEEVAKRIYLPPDICQPPGRPKKSRHKSILEKFADKKRPRNTHHLQLKLGFISYTNQRRLRLEEEVSTAAVKEELSTAAVTEDLDDGEVEVVVRGPD
ncbi:hypothetical protein F2Q70_00015711 [Brassica cretica]|uniref:Uncharacterized protein n=1 Tax=Brassica cretica TaxID=69181 RepID=A0A8S9HWQ7_BRACR|nr:hypothetical protein F2Q70_00015711 [Brassica cretica]